MRRIALPLVAALAVAGFWAQSALAAPKAAVTVNVTATEFKFKLSKTSVPRGSVVTFKVVNKGNAPHDFDFQTLGKGTPYLAPGKSKTYSVTFKKPGSYRFVCTVPRHVELGMSGSFRVK